MKRKKNIISQIILTTLSVLIITSCKKPGTDKQQCRIINMVITQNSTSTIYDISYNNDGKPSKITAPSATKTITYGANSIATLTTDGSGAFLGKVLVTMNNNNNIANIKENYNSSGTNWDNIQIIYDGNGIPVKEFKTTSGSNAVTTINYTVTNGDIVKTSDGVNIDNYGFYADIPYQQGDFLYINSLLSYGVEGYMKNTHLVKSLSSSGASANINMTYDMDEKGKIVKLSLTNGLSAPLLITYQYECN